MALLLINQRTDMCKHIDDLKVTFLSSISHLNMHIKIKNLKDGRIEDVNHDKNLCPSHIHGNACINPLLQYIINWNINKERETSKWSK